MRSRHVWWVAALVAALLLMGAAWGYQRHQLHARLLRASPEQVLADRHLVRAALRIARPVYSRHCAGCHGAALQGDTQHGVPDLAAGAWLYGPDPVGVEHSILYGIRSGHPKARNVAEMPAMVRSGQLSPAEAVDVAQYLLSIAGRSGDAAAAVRGRAIYRDKGNCFDCHAQDARGVPDYGAPPLTGPHYLYGGDLQSLFTSIRDGRHGVCPAWIDVLTPLQVRALAIYLVTRDQRSADSGDRRR